MAEADDEGSVTGSGGGTASQRAAAALVHAFTASGAVCAMLAIMAVMDGAWVACFVWLGVALIIDGIDGTFARMAQVKTRLPRFSGERLDVVVDYVTYVFVPALALSKSGLLGPGGDWLAALILMSSLYHFADNGSKTDDHCFVGFPAIWNIVAFYIFSLPMPPWLASALVVVCALLTFVPLRWLHPMRVARLFWLNMLATVAWLLAAALTLSRGFPASWGPAAVLLAVAVYALWLTLTWAPARPLAPSDASK